MRAREDEKVFLYIVTFRLFLENKIGKTLFWGVFW